MKFQKSSAGGLQANDGVILEGRALEKRAYAFFMDFRKTQAYAAV
jgi:hypothetical protein